MWCDTVSPCWLCALAPRSHTATGNQLSSTSDSQTGVFGRRCESEPFPDPGVASLDESSGSCVRSQRAPVLACQGIQSSGSKTADDIHSLFLKAMSGVYLKNTQDLACLLHNEFISSARHDFFRFSTLSGFMLPTFYRLSNVLG